MVVPPPRTERSCTLIPEPGLTTTEYSGEPGSVVERSITPALALELVSANDVTSAPTDPLPARGLPDEAELICDAEDVAPTALMVQDPVDGA